MKSDRLTDQLTFMRRYGETRFSSLRQQREVFELERNYFVYKSFWDRLLHRKTLWWTEFNGIDGVWLYELTKDGKRVNLSFISVCPSGEEP